MANDNEWALIEAGQGPSTKRGWVKTLNLHVQLVRHTQQHVGKLGKVFFVLQAGQRVVVGNTLHDTDTLLRRSGNNEKDFNGKMVRNSDHVTVLETRNDFARIKAVKHAAERWIKFRNLHVQMIEPEMRLFVNGSRVSATSLPARWIDLCFGIQFFDNSDEIVILSEPEPFNFELNVTEEELGGAIDHRLEMLTNVETRKFWRQCFHQMPSVSWPMLSAALENKFGLDQSQLSRIQPKLDIDSNCNITQIEFNIFTAEHGIQGALHILEDLYVCVTCHDKMGKSCGILCSGSSIPGKDDGAPPHFLCCTCVGMHVKSACDICGSFEKRDSSSAGSIPCCLFLKACTDGALPVK